MQMQVALSEVNNAAVGKNIQDGAYISPWTALF